MLSKRTLLLLCFIYFGLRPCCFAQLQKQNIDSLNVVLSMLVYNDPEGAIEKGKDIYNSISDTEENNSSKISVLLTIANAYAVLKQHENVFKYAQMAETIAEKSNNYTDQVKVLGFMGGQYQRLKLKDKALHYLDKAQEVTNLHPLPDTLQYLKGNILFVKGLVQKDNLGCSYALPYFEESEEVHKKSKRDEDLKNATLSMICNTIGYCYLETGNMSQAKAKFMQAIAFAESIKSTKNQATGKLGLGRIFIIEKKYKEAIPVLEEALELIKDVHDLATENEIYKNLSEACFHNNDEKKYKYYTKMYLQDEKKLVEEENKSVNSVMNKMVVESKKNQEKNKEKYFYGILFTGFLVFIIALFFTLKIISKRKKIQMQREKLEHSKKM